MSFAMLSKFLKMVLIFFSFLFGSIQGRDRGKTLPDKYLKSVNKLATPLIPDEYSFFGIRFWPNNAVSPISQNSSYIKCNWIRETEIHKTAPQTTAKGA